jgi:hypothetical protein
MKPILRACGSVSVVLGALSGLCACGNGADAPQPAPVSAPGWRTAEPIETNDAGDARTPQIVFDANGNAIAVWQQFDGQRTNIWSNRFDSGVTVLAH